MAIDKEEKDLILSRRHLRVKVLQAAYAYQQSQVHDLQQGEKALTLNVQRLLDTFHYVLHVLEQIAFYTHRFADEQDARMMATIEGRKEARKFADNPFALALANHGDFQKALKKAKLNHILTVDLLRTLFNELQASEAYKTYLANPEDDFSQTAALYTYFIRTILENNEAFNSHLEELSIFWQSDRNLVLSNVALMLKRYGVKGELGPIAISLAGNEDVAYARKLFEKAVLNDEELTTLVAGSTNNWSSDRIAITDIIILKLALSELLYFEEIPQKVTLNEYIEISKNYSTPKSKQFVNGVLDKIMRELTEAGRIVKTGRGLIGNSK